ncbi:MAG: hypothetical protein QXV96_03920 [Candidatus Bathyarchaeia archaeon]
MAAFKVDVAWIFKAWVQTEKKNRNPNKNKARIIQDSYSKTAKNTPKMSKMIGAGGGI